TNKAANEVMDELVKNNPNSFRAFVMRALYRKELGLLDKAEEDLAHARDQLQSAEEDDVLLVSAELARARASAEPAQAREQNDLARKFLEKGVQLYPRRTAFYTSLAELEVHSGKLEEGISWVRRGLKESPGNGDLLWSLTELLTQTPDGREEAGANIERMRAPGSTSPLVDYLDARLLLAREEWHSASQILEKLHPQLGKLPELAKKADLLLAECYDQLGDADQQYAVCRRVLAEDPLSSPAFRGMA